jgi:hypothetical protein
MLMRVLKLNVKRASFISAVVILVGISEYVISLAPFAIGDNMNKGVFSVQSKPYGLTYPEWSVKFWQWFMGIPGDTHPMNDISGKNCGTNQNDSNMWYLTGAASGTVERTCSIPAGKAILVLVAGNECSYAEYPNLKSESELRACAVSGNEVYSIDASIDGVPIKDIRNYRVQSPFFNLTYPENNVFGAPAGPSQAVSDDFLLILEPLKVGKHDLDFSQTTLDNPTTGTQSFAYAVKYHLIVVGSIT